MNTTFRLVAGTALLLLSHVAGAAQNGLSNGKPSQNISVGVVSVVVAPAASVAESVQGHNPVPASGLALVGTSYVVAGVVEAGADVVELLLTSASTGAKLSVKLSGQAVHNIGVSVGNTVEFTAHASGTMLVASGKVLAFIPNAVGEALLSQQRLPAQ
jgi:hypothetical protein